MRERKDMVKGRIIEGRRKGGKGRGRKEERGRGTKGVRERGEDGEECEVTIQTTHIVHTHTHS